MIESRRATLQTSIAILTGAYAALIAVMPNRNSAAAIAAPLVIVPGCWWILLRPARWVGAFIGAAILLPPFPLALGNSGPHICLAFAALGLFAGTLGLAEWRIRFDTLTRACVLLFSVLLLSVGFAAIYSGAAIAAASLARVLLFGIGLYIFFYMVYGPGAGLQSQAPSLRPLFWAAIVSALFACIDFYYQLPAPTGFGPQYVWLASGVYRRAQGVFYEASTLGNFCAFFVVMIAVALTRPRKEVPVSRPALLLGGVALSAALVFSYSRASVLNLAAALGALLFLHRSRIRSRRAAAWLLISIACGVAVSYLAFPSFVEIYWARLVGSALYFFTYTGGILSGRLQSWQTLAEFLAERPWHIFLGVGYKTLPYSDFVGRPVIADNMYLSMLVETGIIGLAALLWFNFAILQTAWRAAHQPDRPASFFGAWIFCFWVGQVFQMLSADLLTYWRVLPAYFLVLAWALPRTREHSFS
jgi:O-antigen ligase